jgi:hypothetical protein
LKPPFYVVSTRKFALLFLATLGLYPVYWFYKNWDRYKDRVPAASQPGTNVAPVVRALFSIFFVHALLRKVQAWDGGDPVRRAWSSGWHATWIVVLLLAGECIDTLVDGTAGPPFGDLASFAILVLLLFAFLKAQRMINLACGDPEGAGNARLTRANRVWIVLGGIGWVVTIAMALMGK